MNTSLIERHTIAVLVDNEAGVLARVVGLFSGRGYNIESLTVAEVDPPAHTSRITIVTSGTLEVLEQIRAQLGRLEDAEVQRKGSDLDAGSDRPGRIGNIELPQQPAADDHGPLVIASVHAAGGQGRGAGCAGRRRQDLDQPEFLLPLEADDGGETDFRIGALDARKCGDAGHRGVVEPGRVGFGGRGTALGGCPARRVPSHEPRDRSVDMDDVGSSTKEF